MKALVFALAIAGSAVAVAAQEAAKPAPATSAPVVVRSLSPDFPVRDAIHAVDHRFVVRARIDARGRVVAAGILESDSPHLNPAMLAALQKWEFAPAVRDGTPVSSTIELPIRVQPSGELMARY
jgi:protein TonB